MKETGKIDAIGMALATMLALAIVALAPALTYAQDAGRASTRPNAFSMGVTCPAGQVVTINAATGVPVCTDTVANSQNAVNAQNATTAATSQSLDPNAQINANQLQGTLSSSQLGVPTCASGQVLTNTNGNMSCVASAATAAPAPSAPASCGAYPHGFQRAGTCNIESSVVICNNGTWQGIGPINECSSYN
ncbi:MAG: hypothetical protein ING19_06570 [Azospirillum sp.]|nr:hypothetical protein [Azospirillum sp.]